MMQALLDWYAQNGRDLPWRRTKDPYRLFISEMMLQQTQVDRVTVFYRRWIKRFPGWRILAKARTSDVLRAWSGLGYNRRALYIQEAAKAIEFNKRIPQDEDGWRRLKGVGSYAAASLAAFINHLPTLVVDTNIRRVIGRAYLKIAAADVSADQRIRNVIAKEIASVPWTPDIYQALMDLGANICTAAAPKCDQCPWRSACSLPNPDLHPRPRKRVSRERIHPGKKFPDRIYRGRILRYVMQHPGCAITSCLTVCDAVHRTSDLKWIYELVDRLARDGLVVKKNQNLFLP